MRVEKSLNRNCLFLNGFLNDLVKWRGLQENARPDGKGKTGAETADGTFFV